MQEKAKNRSEKSLSFWRISSCYNDPDQRFLFLNEIRFSQILLESETPMNNLMDYNFHSHTWRCKHAQMVDDEEFVKAYIQNGFKTIAFTDHTPQHPVIDPRKNIRMDFDQLEDYLTSIEMLKAKYQDQIDIKTGLEVEYLPELESFYDSICDRLDLMILGQHFIRRPDGTLVVMGSEEVNDEDVERYAHMVVAAMEKGQISLVAHPDYYMLNRTTFGPAQEKAARRICEASLRTGIPLEINLLPPYKLNQGIIDKVTYPCADFWKIAAEYGVHAIYGLDTHHLPQIDNYKDSIETARKLLSPAAIDHLHFVR